MKEFSLTSTTSSRAFTGNWIFKKNGSVLTNNLGAEIRLLSSGNSELVFDWRDHTHGQDRSRILVSIDQRPFVSLVLGNEPFSLPLGSKGKHLVRIMTQSLTYVKAKTWDLEDYFLLDSISYQDRLEPCSLYDSQIVFIGDSITNGQKTDAFISDGAAHRPDFSWDFLLSEALAADNLRLAYGGCGITQKANIYPPTAIDFIWQYAKGKARQIDYNRKNKAVIVNLGTNDKAASDMEFLFSLKALVRELKKRFHDDKIIVIEPFDGSFKNVFEDLLANDRYVDLVSNKRWNFQKSDRVHLTRLGHRQAFTTLLPIIKEKLNDKTTASFH